jgi:predicted enzyme related to lactoylglutathione lyase
MIFEHFALNVADPIKFVNWYTSNCGMKVLRSMKTSPYTHFLADSAGNSVIEIYSNRAAKIPDYNTYQPIEFHFAFTVDDVNQTREKLISAGAKLVEEVKLDDGSHLVMLRDPFGIPLQLCKRAVPLV